MSIHLTCLHDKANTHTHAGYARTFRQLLSWSNPSLCVLS